MDAQKTAAPPADAPAAAAALPPPPAHHARAMQASRPHSPRAAPPVQAPPTKRAGGRGRGRGRRGAAAQPQVPDEIIKLGPEVMRGSERLRVDWRPVQLSDEEKAAEVELDARQLSASSISGYRMVRPFGDWT